MTKYVEKKLTFYLISIEWKIHNEYIKNILKV